MADNVGIQLGADADVATDQVEGTGEHVQLFKLAVAADGSRTLVPADADGLLVNLGSNNDVVVSSSALPSGAATSAKQDTGNTSLASIDSKLDSPIAVEGPLTDTELRASAVPISAAALPLPSGAATGAKQDTGNTSLASIDGKITAVNTGAVVVSSSALPSGAATGAKQDTGNASLSSIDGKLTNPLPISGTVTANLAAGTNNIGDVDVLSLPAIPAGNNNIGDVDVASIAAGDNNIGNVDVVTLPAITFASPQAVTQSGTWNVGTVTTVTTVTTVAAVTSITNPVAVTNANLDVALSTLATASKQDLLLAELQLKANLDETQPVSGPLTDAELRASEVETSIKALVSDGRESYTSGELQSPSLTTDGRLRVATSESYANLEMFRDTDDLFFGVPVMAKSGVWVDMPNNPWGL